MFDYKTRENTKPYGKPRAFIDAAPGEIAVYSEKISEMLLELWDCTVFFENVTASSDKRGHDFLESLNNISFIVIAVTKKYISEYTQHGKVLFEYAKEKNIPLLPLMMEPDLEEEFNRTCGSKHVLKPDQINFKEKLLSYMKSVLADNELTERIRAAFDTYIFISYRKKDIKHAKELIRLIRGNEFCRNIAIWYDDYLVAGENYNIAIENALKKSELFALVVTDNLVNEDNYVMAHEYPMAQENEKEIFPTEFVNTDKALLEEKYPGIPDCVGSANEKAFSAALKNALNEAEISFKEEAPERTYLIGVAYFQGIDVDIDKKLGIELITSAAEDGHQEAMEKLVHIYWDHCTAIPRDLGKVIKWCRRILEIYGSKLDDGSVDDYHKYCYYQAIILDSMSRSDSSEIEKILDNCLSAIKICENGLKKYNDDKIKNLLSHACHAAGDIIRINLLNNSAERLPADCASARDYFQKAYDVLISMEKELDAAEINKAVGDLIDIAETFRNEKRFDEALEYLNKAIKFRETHDTEEIGKEADILLPYAYCNIGKVYVSLQRFDEAEKYFAESVKLAEQTYKVTELDEACEALVYCSQAQSIFYRESGNLEKAEEAFRKETYYAQVLSLILPKMDTFCLLMDGTLQLGEILEKQGKMNEAYEVYWKMLSRLNMLYNINKTNISAGLPISELFGFNISTNTIEFQHYLGEFFERTGFIQLQRGEYDDGEASLNSAEMIFNELFDKTNSDSYIIIIYRLGLDRAQFYIDSGEYDKAAQHNDRLLNYCVQKYSISKNTTFLVITAEYCYQLGRVYMNNNLESEAENYFFEVQNFFVDMCKLGKEGEFDKNILVLAAEERGKIYLRRGEWARARHFINECIQCRRTELPDRIDTAENLKEITDDYINIGYTYFMEKDRSGAFSAYSSAQSFCKTLISYDPSPQNIDLYNKISEQLERL